MTRLPPPPPSPEEPALSTETAALEEACRLLDLKSHDARALHRHATTVYLLESENAVVRMTQAPPEPSERAVTVTRWLIDQGFAATEPLNVEQPVAVDGWTITCWQHYPQTDRPLPEPAHLGGLLRRLHSLAPPPIDLPPYRPLASLEPQIRAARFLPPDDRSWLLARSDELLSAYAELDFPLGHGHIHGDAYPGNLLWDGTQVVLGDWDETSLGPRELDLVNTYQGARFGRTGQQLLEFADAYEYDVTRWPGFPTLRAIRDLHTLGAYLRRGDPAATRQVLHRVGTLKRGDLAARWTTG